MDLRFLALGAILSDLIDLPIGIVFWSDFQAVRLAGHSMLFGALLMVIVLLITRRGIWRKRLILLATGVLLHLALDSMWQSPETLWWPFLGDGFQASGFASYGAYVADLVANPLVWLGEAVGLAYVAVLWRKAGLSDRDARRSFTRTGIVSAPIDRT